MKIASQRKLSLPYWDILLVTCLSLGGLGLYVRTLVAWPLTADSGEFQVLAHQLGMAHTTGYPVYILLAKLFTILVPVRDIAYRVNLFSAVMGILTVVEMYWGGRILSKSRAAGLFGALILLVSYTFWSQAIIAEVYTLTAALLMAVWLSLLLWHKTDQVRWLFVAGLLGSIGLGVHGHFFTLLPGVIVFLWLKREKWKVWWISAFWGCMVGLILLTGAYLMVDLHAPPANIWNTNYGPSRSNWGLTETDIANPLKRIAFVISTQEFSNAMFQNPAKQMPRNITAYIKGFPNEFSLWVVILIILGVAALVQQDRQWGVLLGISLFVHWVFFFNYAVGDIHVFYIPGYLLLAWLAVTGLGKLLQWVEKLPWNNTHNMTICITIILLLVSTLPRIYPLRGLLHEHIVPFIGQRGFIVDENTLNMYRAVKETVRLLPPNSIVFTRWGYLYLYYYVAQVEQQRTDLLFVSIHGATEGGLSKSLIELISDNIHERPIYFTLRDPDIEMAGFTSRGLEIGPLDIFQVIENQTSP